MMHRHSNQKIRSRVELGSFQNAQLPGIHLIIGREQYCTLMIDDIRLNKIELF